ncbi:MAG: RagB/SusD family nutrient uptake outer membrane protein [Tannerellaceae bacterium]|nr:RagB/SusD family nutrient uptake outer membrane protein [Tannerellaceae bacterium]
MTICFFGITACNDFLKENPISDISKDEFFSSRNDAYSAVNILYRKGCLALMSSGSYLGSQYMYTTGFRSGLIDNPNGRGNNPTISRIQTLSINPVTDNGYIQALWSGPYETIVRNANFVLENLPACPGLTDNERKQLIGEACFFRALNYFYLVQTWGAIPIVLMSYSSLDDIYTQRSSEKLVYQQILSDLEVALNAGLPDKPMPQNGFRISRASVLALAADVCLNMAGAPVNDASKYADAARYAKELISSPNYALIQHGADMSDPANWGKSAYNTLRTSDDEKEYLFVREYDAVISNGGEKPTWCLPFEASSWGFKYPVYINAWNPHPILHAAYDADDDLRYQEKQYFHSSYTTPDGVEHKFEKIAYFWWEETALLETARSEKDLTIYRLAEMYLIAAEALVKAGGSVTDEAAGYLAEIKARASLSKDAATIKNELLALTAEAFADEVLAEKIRETLFEFKLWNDIARTRKYPALDGNGKFTFIPLIGAVNPWGATYTEDNLYFPYPDQVKQRNPLMAEKPLE